MGYAAASCANLLTMIFIAFVVLLSLALAARWRHRRWLAAGLLALAVLLFVLIGCGPLPRWMMNDLQAPYALRPALRWAPSNAIVLLTGDAVSVPGAGVEPSPGVYARIAEAAVLYHDCRRAGVTCRLLVSGGDPSRLGTTLAASYAVVLRGLGVASDDLILESRSNNTWQNAKFCRPLLAALGAPKVWLVSSGFHLRRSVLYFAHFGIVAIPVRADYWRASLTDWPSPLNFVLTDIAMHEYLGIARYYVYNAMGWNVPQLPPLAAAQQRTTAGAVVRPAQASASSEARSITKR